MRHQFSSSLIATPEGILLDGMLLHKSAVRQQLSSRATRYIDRAEELLKQVAPEDWDDCTPHNPNDVPALAKAQMMLALANPILLDKYSSDQSRDWHGRWTSDGTDASINADHTGEVADSGMIMSDAGSKPDVKSAIRALQNNAKSHSQSRCAEYVRRALNQGGFGVGLPDNNDEIKQAKDYGQPLEDAGFAAVASTSDSQGCNLYPLPGYTPQAGDVAIIQTYPGGNASGHMTMYDGKQWISDFKQIDMWGGKGRRRYAPPYVIYRYKSK
ncbi:MAG TPA: hypothetical protein VFT64_00575 [Rickettsiales bacterium]|nr:hypothetical protein [Rickettsiales bacterium]